MTNSGRLGEAFELPFEFGKDRPQSISQERDQSVIVLLLQRELRRRWLSGFQGRCNRELFEHASLALQTVRELVWRPLHVFEQAFKECFALSCAGVGNFDTILPCRSEPRSNIPWERHKRPVNDGEEKDRVGRSECAQHRMNGTAGGL
jgi:hypothetical protein